MNTIETNQRSLTVARALIWALVAVIVAEGTVATPAMARDRDARPPRKERRKVDKPAHTVVTDHERHDVVIVKFQEGTQIRKRERRLLAQLERLSPGERRRRKRMPVDDQVIVDQVEELNDLLATPTGNTIERLFDRPEEELDREHEEAEANVDEELADLNLYYRIVIDGSRRDRAERLIDKLNSLDIVEIAYAQPIPEVAATDIAPATPSYAGRQDYLDPAPTGIDFFYARNRWGLPGSGTRIIDVELNWRLDHEDLKSPFYSEAGRAWAQADHHGTAVLGVMLAQDNGYGMSGIAPAAEFGVAAAQEDFICPLSDKSCKTAVYDAAGAINRAAAQLRRGDIMLIEQHAKGPKSGETCVCNCDQFDAAGRLLRKGQFEFVPMEYFQAEYDAIRAATAKGIIVVEAGGNGSMDLDDPRYGRRFDRTFRDSGAILVGAGVPYSRATECWTNYGSRMDSQGWGSQVATLGYGDLLPNGVVTDRRQWYTETFSGTSSATPIVAGAAAVIQSYRQSRFLAVLGPADMRDVLRWNSNSSAPGHIIGSLPDLRRVLAVHGAEPVALGTPRAVHDYLDGGYLPPDGSKTYRFSARKGKTYTFDTCYSAPLDTVLEIRSGTSQFVNEKASGLLVSNDDSCGENGLQSKIVWKAPASTTYYLRLKGYSASTVGLFDLEGQVD